MTYHTHTEIVEMAQQLKAELGLSDAQIAKELTEDLEYPITQQNVNKAMNGSPSYIKALMTWLESRWMIQGRFTRDDSAKPVVFYRIEYEDDLDEGGEVIWKE